MSLERELKKHLRHSTSWTQCRRRRDALKPGAASWLWRAFSRLNTFCNYTPSRSADRKISVTFEKEGRKQLGLTVGFAVQQPRPATGVEAVSSKTCSGVFFFSESDPNVHSFSKKIVLTALPAGVAVLSMVSTATLPRIKQEQSLFSISLVSISAGKMSAWVCEHTHKKKGYLSSWVGVRKGTWALPRPLQ